MRLRYAIWLSVAILLVGIFGKVSHDEHLEYLKTIEVKEVYAYVDKSLKDSFEDISDDEDVVPKYKISYSNDASKSNIIFTSDFSKINSEEEYELLNYSPLIFAMKSAKDLNNFLVSNTKDGWLISDSEIQNSNEDKINCDFKKVFNTVIDGGDWSNIGGPSAEIKIFCPYLETTEGKLFKEFLVRILNNGSKTSNAEIDSQIDKFFSSDNVIQTDVISKLEKLQNDIPENELYVELESKFLGYVNSKYKKDISFIYPEACVLREIYLQYNDIEDKLKNELESVHCHGLVIHEGANNHFYYAPYYYRDGEQNKFYSIEYFNNYNFQQGINTFDMKN